ncbi:hypothetical protein XELAEV_18032250mg [Xenopus laevis]|uniref:Uncharacterized protein n=1 Tax=Xenopus laevis TaxID=8355 RepID=A0A974CPM8_XENLA|nr:hypothetical protein XELAEV_18032250mg [Xenopus laevis]
MHSPSCQRKWLDTESPTVIWIPTKNRPKDLPLPPQLKFIISNWDTLNQNGELGRFPSLLTALSSLPQLLQDLPLQNWFDKGITTISDHYSIKIYRTFPELQFFTGTPTGLQAFIYAKVGTGFTDQWKISLHCTTRCTHHLESYKRLLYRWDLFIFFPY